MRKDIIRLLHKTKNISKNLCNNKYPLGRTSNISKKIIKKSNIEFESNDYREFINHDEFKTYSCLAYKKILKTFYHKLDFLDFNYTSPELSIVLGDLINDIKDIQFDKIKYEVENINSEIINIWYEYGFTQSNNKFLGFLNGQEIIHEIMVGMIGPEIRHIWDQKAIKQKVLILYDSDIHRDLFEWERDLMLPDQNWQVSNINGLLIKE